MELSYDGGKKWRVLCGDGKTKRLQSTWEKETPYQVAIVLQNGTQGTVYVDGQRVCGGAQRNSDKKESKGISHFYIGGDGDSADNTGSQGVVRVTVKNVLLHNRPWTLPGDTADVEEVADSPPEAASPSMSVEQIAAPPAGRPSEAPVLQANLQRPPQKSKSEINTAVGECATTQQVLANTLQGSVGKAATSNSHIVGEATGDAGTMRVGGLLPLLVVGLWAFAAL
ncbi:trans-sialidase, putative [Trypanosoma cruzi marinkellei]|uniref:Trans-sialidase, putative n=1 Tax=Trypanosoma cruzi marinkellei TaxID=85056 RepID=K2MQ87_TRYCR|nr:trans-sialidase, putative [Trypanosoma cruzi marinkellei]